MQRWIILAIVTGLIMVAGILLFLIPGKTAQAPTTPGETQEWTTLQGNSDILRDISIKPGDTARSPLKITGEARGNWYFEASFPVSLVNWDGLIIAQGPAQAQGEWMTEEFVPFEITLEFENPSWDADFSKRGALILQKDNPSGLPEHDDSLEIPVVFE